MVCGLTTNIDHRARGSVLLIAAMNSRSRRRRRGRLTWHLRTISWWRSTTTSTSVFRSLEELARSRRRRRSRRYLRAKSTDRTSHEKEGRSYEPAGHGDAQGFVCPSGDPIRLLVQPMEREFEDVMCWVASSMNTKLAA